jgi:hypothetical protein
MKLIGCFLLAFVFLSLPAFAEDVTLFAGFQHPGKINLSSTTGTTTQVLTSPTNVGDFGIRFGTSKAVGSEHTLAFAPNFLSSDTKAIIYNSNLIVQIPTPIIKPYATAGMGAVISWGSVPSGLKPPSDIGKKFALNYGGGVKVTPKGKGIGARLDVRGYVIPSVQSQTLNVVEVSLGVLFGF